jgi:polysaccharide export outer membrane protein
MRETEEFLRFDSLTLTLSQREGERKSSWTDARMKKGLLMLAFAAQVACAATPDSPSPASTDAAPGYRVGPGDVIEISVWKEQELSKQTLVRPDGGISFPLIGEIRAGGRTIDDIRRQIVERLAEYFAEPAVSVSLANINQKIYVVGKVNKPGEFVTPESVSVMQALSMAGGLTPFADNDDIMIIRKIAGKDITFPFDYDKVSAGGALDQDIVLQRGDVVVVP